MKCGVRESKESRIPTNKVCLPAAAGNVDR